MSRYFWAFAAFFPLFSTLAMVPLYSAPSVPAVQLVSGILLSIFMLGGAGCTLAYFIHMITNKRRETAHRVMWVIGLLFFRDLILPVYYFTDVRPYLAAADPSPVQTSRFRAVAPSRAEATDTAEAAPEAKAEEKVRRMEPELDERGRRKRRNEMRRPRRREPW